MNTRYIKPATKAYTVDIFGVVFNMDYTFTKDEIFVAPNIRIRAGAKFGEGTLIRANAIINQNVNIGKDVMIGNYTLIRENVTIGNNTKIGSFVVVEWGATIGMNTNIQGHNTIGEKSKVGNEVFIAPFVVNMGENEMGRQEGEYKPYPATIKSKSRIGAGSKLLPGITIGENTLIGAGSIVTKNTKNNEIWFGEAAKLRGTQK